MSRLRWWAKALTPPIFLLGLRKLFPKRESPPPPASPSPAVPTTADPPEWEYVPEGWAREARGWNADGVLETYRAKWPAFREALESPRPLGVNHEAPIDAIRAGDDLGAQNQLLTFAYVLALAAQGRDRVSVLDWGGGIGHYYAVAKSLYPDLQVEYTCFDVPVLAAEGRRLFPEAMFLSDMSSVEETYDLVFASSSLQYAEDWRSTLSRLSQLMHMYLCITRVPIALANPSFVTLQRADRHGYGTEYLGWVLNRDEFLDTAEAAGLQVLREFLLTGWISAAGAPERPIGHRGFLFAPYTGAG